LESIFSNLPDRNPFFTGREHVMVQLHEALVAQGRVALSGLGGVGKTQAAVEYTYRHFEEYAYIIWAPAHSHEMLVSSYATMATILKLPEAGAQDQTAAVEAVKCWLGSNQGWLLILDNADDIVMVRAFLPSGRKGHVILTTRAHAAGATARRVGIQEMETEEGALFLLRRATCIAGDASLDTVTESDRAQAERIVAQLDGLPLALDQAAAYIEETSCGLSGYLNLCRSHAAELLRRRGRLSADHLDPVSTTWVLSFENIEKANPAAAELLRFCAFLSADAIPEEMFSESAAELGPELGAVASDPLAWNDALSEILKYSLLRRDRNTSTLEIHRLVQGVLKQAMDEANRRLWAERVVRAINRASPKIEFSTWPLCDRLLPQAHACAGLINQWGFGFPEAARLLNHAGFYLYERGRYTDAKPLYDRALAIREKALGPEHPDVATSLNNLAALYDNQGQYGKAEPLYQRALAIREKALGPEHPDVANSLNNLAMLYGNQGQYGKAEPLYQRALAIREKALGPEHPDVATYLENYALCLRATNRSQEAELLESRAKAIRAKTI
jgi:tetratricopeptide (TPR) repeat protein